MLSPAMVLSVVAVGSVLGGCSASGGPAPQPVNEAASPVLTGSTATLEVHGLSCPLCANNLDKELLRVNGVQAVSVDIGTGMVTLKLASGARVERAAVAEAVRRSGFTLVSVR